MNQILNQIPHKEVNSLILNARWKDLSRYYQEQNGERSTDIEDLLANLSKKMDHTSDKDSNNFKVIGGQIDSLAEQVVATRKILSAAESTINNFIVQQNELNQEKIANQAKQRRELEGNKIDTGDQIVKEVKKEFLEAHEKVLQEATELYSQFETAKNSLVGQIKKNQEFHTSAINQIHDEANSSCEEIIEFIREFKENRKEEETKISYMIEELSHELRDTMERQEKAGCIVYDCLLSLIEDSHSKIHEQFTLK